MTPEELVGKTIQSITYQRCVGRDVFKDYITWPVVTLNFTDGTSHSYAEDERDVYETRTIEDNVRVGDVVEGDWFEDDDGQWVPVWSAVVDGGQVFINDEPEPGRDPDSPVRFARNKEAE